MDQHLLSVKHYPKKDNQLLNEGTAKQVHLKNKKAKDLLEFRTKHICLLLWGQKVGEQKLQFPRGKTHLLTVWYIWGKYTIKFSLTPNICKYLKKKKKKPKLSVKTKLY